jgi:hypothetical protein
MLRSQALETIRNLRGLSEVKGKLDALLEAVCFFYRQQRLSDKICLFRPLSRHAWISSEILYRHVTQLKLRI